VAVLIPAFKASGTIEQVIRGVERFVSRQDIIVIDDGSGDSTGQLARATGSVVLNHRRNLGKGAALQTGFRHALAAGYEGVMIIDADGQHDPAFIPHFLERASQGNADILIGSRTAQAGQMPPVRILTNRITSAIVSALAGQRIADSQSGYRFIRAEVLKNLRLRTSRYDTESEMLIQAGRKGFRIGALPISCIYRDEKSAIKPLQDTLRFIRLVLRSGFGR